MLFETWLTWILWGLNHLFAFLFPFIEVTLFATRIHDLWVFLFDKEYQTLECFQFGFQCFRRLYYPFVFQCKLGLPMFGLLFQPNWALMFEYQFQLRLFHQFKQLIPHNFSHQFKPLFPHNFSLLFMHLFPFLFLALW